MMKEPFKLLSCLHIKKVGLISITVKRWRQILDLKDKEFYPSSNQVATSKSLMSGHGNQGPVPFITLENGKFAVNQKLKEKFGRIKGEIAVLSVAGLYRTGKSYILNRFIGRQDGFAVGPSINPCTKGIYVWGDPIRIISEKTGKSLSIILVDTEGIGSIQQDQTYDTKIFSLSLLLSSYFIYNSMNVIDEKAIDSLSLVAHLSSHIQVRSDSKKSNESELASHFPKFLWLLRDFTLELEDENGNKITSTQYLEKALAEIPDFVKGSEEKNEIRRKFKTLFPNRDCTVIVRPVTNEKDLRNVDKIPFEKLRQDFQKQCTALVKRVFAEIEPKKIAGKELTGLTFLKLAESYTNSINGGGIPNIHSALHSVSIIENQSVVEESFHHFTNYFMAEYKKQNLPIPPQDLHNLYKPISEKAIHYFYERSLGEESMKKPFEEKLIALMESKYQMVAQENSNALFNNIQSLQIKELQDKVRIQTLENEVEKAKISVMSSEKDNTVLKNQVKTLEKEKKDINDNLKNTSTSILELKNNLQTEKENYKKLLSDNQRLQAEVKTLRTKNSNLKLEVDKLNGSVSSNLELQNKLQTEKENYKKLLSDHQRVQIEVKTLRTKTSNLKLENEKLNVTVSEDLKHEQNVSMKLKDDLQRHQNENKTLKAKIKALENTQANNSKREQAELNNTIKNLEDSLSKELENMQALQVDYQKLQTESDRLKTHVSKLEQELDEVHRFEPMPVIETPPKSTRKEPKKKKTVTEFMDIENEMPIASVDRSKRKQREEDDDSSMRTPLKKRNQDDPEGKTIQQLKQTLTKLGVKLPPSQQKKQYYVELYKKHV